ncbi:MULTISPECIES: universal stress protein [Gordonia]|uniref:universal stress protein n=1 Tax=Gordonia TaxID=2053 RepID=UPI0007E98155|nr:MULTISPECIES: universal stress protein [Gordonia]MCM3896928.1 universal stress protein [Gordonia sputi]OBA59168.1 universal stress protein [Gordonia sp. 852002-10350_SCH5691597]
MSTDDNSAASPKRVAVGYLATQSGDDGVALGAAIATKTGAAIDLICVVHPVPYDGQPGIDQYMERLENQAAEWLADGASRIPEGIEVRTVVTVHESFTEGLIEVAEQTGAAMIVVGGTGDGIISRHALGTVSTELLHSSPLPVALAPRGYARRSDVVIDMITVAVPVKKSASDPLPFAIRFAEAASIDVRLLSLVSLDPTVDDTSLAVRKQQVDVARKLLEHTRDQLDVDLEVDVLVADGDTLDEALANLPWDANDIVAVGSGHLGADNRVFLGTTAARILRWTTAPVIVVPKESTADTEATEPTATKAQEK